LGRDYPRFFERHTAILRQALADHSRWTISGKARQSRSALMTEPIFFLSHFRIKEGGLDVLRRLTREVTPQLEAEKPRTVLFLSYLSSDGGEISFLHAFADAKSMDLHIVGSDERSRAAYGYMEPLGWEIYGKPSAAALEGMRQAAASAGVPLALHPEYLAGFLRLGGV
jgi:hypothetical protein